MSKKKKDSKQELQKGNTSHPKCAKCGACTSVCPVYKVTGRESLSARGKIHLLSKQTNLKKAGGILPELFSKCLLCGACVAACPRNIDICEIVQEAREIIPEVAGIPGVKKNLCRQVLARPKLMQALGLTSRSLQNLEKLIPSTSGLRLRLGLPSSINQGRTELPVPKQQANNNEAKVLYFSGCMATYLAHDIRDSSLKLLSTLCQMPATIIKEQNCCGMAALASGNKQQARELAIKNIESFTTSTNSDLPIFTSCATCYSQLRSYKDFFADDPKWSEPAAKFSSRIWEFSTFLLQYGKNIEKYFSAANRTHSVIYHDPCHLRFIHHEGSTPILAPPRKLLNFIPGLQLEELPHGPQCCGQGGLFNIAHPDLSREIGQNIKTELQQTKASIITTTCTGCLTQWQQLLQEKNSPQTAIHMAVMLASHLPDN